jgi:hypothetical protein
MRCVKLLFVVMLGMAAWACAQSSQPVFNLNTTVTQFPVVLPIACLGNSSECAANNNSSYLGAGSYIVGEENTGGTGQVAMNPGAGITYCRVTDSNTDIQGRSFSPSTAESGGNSFSIDNKYMYVRETGGFVMFFSLDPTQVCSVARWSTYRVAASGVVFSKNTPGLVYLLTISGAPKHVYIQSLDLTQTPSPTPTITTLVDLTTQAGCLSSYTMSGYATELTMSANDQTFFMGLGINSEGQDQASLAVVWDKTKGCRWLNVKTLIVSGTWGPTGSTTDSPQCFIPGIHQTVSSGDGAVMGITANNPVTGDCGTTNIYYQFWPVATLNYIHQTAGNIDTTLGGHYATGQSLLINKVGVSYPTYGSLLTTFLRPLGNPIGTFVQLNKDPRLGAITYTSPNCSSTYCPDWDTHPSWNTSVTDKEPVFITTAGIRRIPLWPMENELVIANPACYVAGVANSCAGNAFIRVSHHYSDSSTYGAYDYNGGAVIHNVATYPTKGYYLWAISTNWENQLGCATPGQGYANDHVCGKLQTAGVVAGHGGTGWTTGDTCVVNDNFAGSTYGSGGILTVTASGGAATGVVITSVGQNYQQLLPNGNLGPTIGAPCIAISGTGNNLLVSATATLGRSDVVLVRVPATLLGSMLQPGVVLKPGALVR